MKLEVETPLGSHLEAQKTDFDGIVQVIPAKLECMAQSSH